MEIAVDEKNPKRHSINRYLGVQHTPETPSPEAIQIQLIADKLSTFPLATVERLDLGGSNGVFLVNLEGDGSAIAKPADEETPSLRTDVKEGSYYKRERAAFLVDQALGINLVPPTVIRTILGSPASVQQFIPNTETACVYGVSSICEKARGDKNLAQQLDTLLVFDYLIFNSDRHSGNWLFSEDKLRIYAIDNGLSFGNDYLRQNDTSYNLNNTPEILGCLEKLINNPERLTQLKSDLSQLIEESEVEAFHNRLLYIYDFLKKYRDPYDIRVRLLFNPEPE